jgi:hypothetical protein
MDANARRRASALSDALRGRMLQGTQDATVSNLPYGVNVPTVTGGQRPSNITGAADFGKTLAAHGDAALAAPDLKPQNFDNLAPGPNLIDRLTSGAGQVSSILGTLGKLSGLVKGAAPAAATSLIPAAEGGVTTAAGGGGVAGAGGLGLLGGATLGAGAALAIGLAIKHHQNATKGDRNNFARDAGFKDIADFNNYLSTLGPAGQEARNYGENVVGKHNKQHEAQWMQMVQAAVDASGKPLQTGQTPKPFGRA